MILPTYSSTKVMNSDKFNMSGVIIFVKPNVRLPGSAPLEYDGADLGY